MLYVVARHEFIQMLKSFKSIAVILFLTLFSFASSSLVARFAHELGDTEVISVYFGALKVLVFLFGFLLVFALSHDSINRELDLQTVRLVVTKVPRPHFSLGKTLGILGFWIVCMAASFVLIALFAKQILFLDFLVVMIFLFYAISLNMLLSVIIPKPGVSMFLGILSGLAIPIMGLWATYDDGKWWLLPFKYALPYFYLIENNWMLVFPVILALIFLATAVELLKRKDL